MTMIQLQLHLISPEDMPYMSSHLLESASPELQRRGQVGIHHTSSAPSAHTCPITRHGQRRALICRHILATQHKVYTTHTWCSSRQTTLRYALWQFVALQSLCHVWIFVTPWTVGCQAPLSFTTFWSSSNSCPLGQWCHPTISASVSPYPPVLNLSHNQGLFQWVRCSASVQFSCSVMSDSLWPHEPQHTRPPCPSPTPGVYPNSCPLSKWCHLTISSSVIPFSSCLQSFPTSGSFQMCQFLASGGQNTGASASTSVLPMNTQDWSPLGWTGWISLQSKGLSRVFSNTTVQKHQFFCTHLSL